MDALEVDGSIGEGGGQILRTAVAFSIIRRAPVRVVNIRAGRTPPGLKRQHLAALQVLSRVFGGSLQGATEGSSTVVFGPGPPSLGTLDLDMGTAASITLVLQAVVPAVALSGSTLTLRLVGGTDVPWSPTFDYFQRVALEGYRMIGISAEATCTRRGYYPKGGGRVTAEIRPCIEVKALDLPSVHGISEAQVVSRCSSLPRVVAERQFASAVDALSAAGVRAEGEVIVGESTSPGTSVLVGHLGPDLAMGGDAIGARGKPSEAVGREAADRFLAALRSGACVDSNLADMVIPLLALTRGRSRVLVPEVTAHLESGLRLAKIFTGCRWEAERQGGGVMVTVDPKVEEPQSKRHNV
jgi:RNA 3'-phosphate cyclase